MDSGLATFGGCPGMALRRNVIQSFYVSFIPSLVQGLVHHEQVPEMERRVMP
jgi:hypothetical protein